MVTDAITRMLHFGSSSAFCLLGLEVIVNSMVLDMRSGHYKAVVMVNTRWYGTKLLDFCLQIRPILSLTESFSQGPLIGITENAQTSLKR